MFNRIHLIVVLGLSVLMVNAEEMAPDVCETQEAIMDEAMRLCARTKYEPMMKLVVGLDRCNNHRADYFIAYFSSRGLYMPFDWERAKLYYERSANNDNQYAQIMMGDLAAKGEYLLQHEDLIVHWYRMAAEAASTRGQYKLGKTYIYGESGVKRDCRTGLKWLRKAADGNLSAAYELFSVLYRDGICVHQDETTSIEMSKKAQEVVSLSNAALTPFEKCLKTISRDKWIY